MLRGDPPTDLNYHGEKCDRENRLTRALLMPPPRRELARSLNLATARSIDGRPVNNEKIRCGPRRSRDRIDQ